MRKPDIRYWVPWLFLLGILIIVFLQVISGYNITRLLNGNRQFTDEMHLRNHLRGLQSDVLMLESDIRGAVIAANPQELEEMPSRIASIDSGLSALAQTHAGTQLDSNIRLLETLVRRKIAFSQEVMQVFAAKGKASAEAIINTNQGKFFRDSIDATLNRLDTLRNAGLQTIVGGIENTGETARLWGLVIALIALVAVIAAFWYTLNQGRQQQKMITLLNESEKRSKEVARMKEQFLANMSHEIRTPMNAILGFTNILRRTSLNADQRQYVQNIHSAGENLLALVNDILDLSKMEAGMMSLEETRFSLQGLVSSVSAMFGEKVREKKLQLQTKIDEAVPDILSGDAVRLTQIMVNLLGNAVKFTEQGYIKVEVSVLRQTENGVRLCIQISDTGIGISAEKQQSIFERFQQAEAETTRRFGGSGLGLAIVKQLVALQNGSITIKSQPGKGSTFSVELDYTVPDAALLYEEALSAQEEAVPLQEVQVLIAEDNPMNQQLISHLMRGWGIEYMMVGNGREAVNELKRRRYSLVLMDIQMPEMDGYTATQIIRGEMGLSIPIIAMTAHAMTGEKEKCLGLGMNDYVSKPIKETVLYNMIGQHAQGIEQEKPTGLIRLDYLRTLSGGDAAFERELLEQFVLQVPQEVAQLERALLHGDFDTMYQTAHSLKSSVGYVGLHDQLLDFLERLEHTATIRQLNGSSADLEKVKAVCAAAVEEIKQVVKTQTF